MRNQRQKKNLNSLNTLRGLVTSVVYAHSYTHIALKEDHLPSQYYLPCGILAGVMSTLITQPADVIKTRMQIQPQVYPTLPITIASVVRDRGLGGLFIGTLPRTTRRTLMAAFTWAFYEQVGTIVLISSSWR